MEESENIGGFPLMGRKFIEFREFDRSLKHELGFKDPVCYLCLPCTVVASVTQEIAYLIAAILLILHFLSLNSLYSV